MFKSITVPEERSCDVKCYIEGNCVSYNIESSTEDGTLTCELNDSGHEMHPVDLKRRFGYIYQPYEVRSVSRGYGCCSFGKRLSL